MRDADWQVGPVETIPMLERPDTAFRKLALTDSGLMMIDDLGKAEGLGRIGAAVLCFIEAGPDSPRAMTPAEYCAAHDLS